MDKEVETRQILALLIYRLGTGGLSRKDAQELVEAMGFDWDVLSRWSDRRRGTGPLAIKPGLVGRNDSDYKDL